MGRTALVLALAQNQAPTWATRLARPRCPSRPRPPSPSTGLSLLACPCLAAVRGSDTESLSPRSVLLQRAREVMSALQFQDRDTAVRLLQEALALLEA